MIGKIFRTFRSFFRLYILFKFIVIYIRSAEGLEGLNGLMKDCFLVLEGRVDQIESPCPCLGFLDHKLLALP